jgi:hypothetical protein
MSLLGPRALASNANGTPQPTGGLQSALSLPSGSSSDAHGGRSPHSATVGTLPGGAQAQQQPGGAQRRCPSSGLPSPSVQGRRNVGPGFCMRHGGAAMAAATAQQSLAQAAKHAPPANQQDLVMALLNDLRAAPYGPASMHGLAALHGAQPYAGQSFGMPPAGDLELGALLEQFAAQQAAQQLAAVAAGQAALNAAAGGVLGFGGAQLPGARGQVRLAGGVGTRPTSITWHVRPTHLSSRCLPPLMTCRGLYLPCRALVPWAVRCLGRAARA